MQLRKQNHTVYKTQYHLVWVTRYRRKMLANDGIKRYLATKLKEVKKHIPDIEYKEIGLDKDHIHLHMIIPPKYKVSKVVNT